MKKRIIIMMIAMMVMTLEVNIDMVNLSASTLSTHTAYAAKSGGGSRSGGGSFKSGGYSAPKSGSSKGSDFKSGSYSTPKQNPQADPKTNPNPNNGNTYNNPAPRQNNWFFGGFGFMPFGFGGYGFSPFGMFSSFFMLIIIVLIVLFIIRRYRR